MKFFKVLDKKAQEFRHIYIYLIVNVMSAAFIAPIPKICVIKVAILQLESETQSIDIHDVYSFNTELAMHYRVIFNCGCFRLFCERRESLLLCFGLYFS